MKIEDIKPTEIDKIIGLSAKYSDVPMDLADASLVIISERLGIKEILTIDLRLFYLQNNRKRNA